MTGVVSPTAARSGRRHTDEVGLYRLMLLSRRMEEHVYSLYQDGLMGGYLHRSDGQEATVVGVVPQLRLPGDYVLCTYRDHCHALACGVSTREIMAELMGRSGGCAGGKGGSMHLIDPDRGFLGGDGIVGGPVPISLGVGFALKYRGGENICVCYFGDGAMNQGGVHEAMNMIALYELPVLLILENNHYAMGTSISNSTAQADFVKKAAAHGIAGSRVDGMDLLAMKDAAREAIEGIRTSRKPYFLEADCYRFIGHGIGDDNTGGQKYYRTPDEVEEWRKRDPIVTYGEWLRQEGLLSAKKQRELETEVMNEVEDAIRFAQESPEPPPDSLYEHVFIGETVAKRPEVSA